MLIRTFTPFPILKTERLTLRQLIGNDEQEIFTLRSDSEINKYLDRKIASTIDEARSFIKEVNENINKIAKYAACFILDENKRVPTNKLIVEYANKVLSVEHCQEAFELYLDSLKGNDIAGLTISFHDNVREVKKTIKEHTKHLFQYCGEISSTTLLIHSDFKYKENEDDDSVYDIIAEMESFLEVLSEKTIERKSKELLAFTTILKYKGLEDNNIILVIPASKIKSSWDNFLFEIYVGMTRAIMNLDIIILKSN